MKHRNNKYFIVSMISLLIGVLPAISWPKSAGASYPIATVTNDDFNNAIVASSSYSNTQSISGATTAIDDPQLSCIFATGYYSIWYKYIPAQNGTLELDTFGSDYDTAMAVWTGSQGSLNEVGCDDDGNPDLTSLISINVTAGTAYYIEVVSYFNSLSGTNLTLSVSQVSGGMPGAFSKSSPSNGESGLDANPTLSWESSSGATSYEYCFDTNNNNTCDTSWVTSGTNTSKSLSGLSLGTTYYWQARAHNNTGTTLANSGSWWSFTTS
ncbi:MAG TPA: hypothetical protein PLX14_14950, partial [Anaerolineales bacterium]|nr:hypothetical protein [Anaerolineales bacterium]